MNKLSPELHDSALFSNDRWLAVCVSLIALMLLPVLTYSTLDHPPEYDELLHVIAARSINTTDSPSIADGLYTRALLYTRLIAIVTSEVSNELFVARLPAVFFGALLASLLGFWVTRRVGWLAGIASVFVLVVAPMTLNASILVRFYTAHTLVMMLMLILWFELVTKSQTLVVKSMMLAASVALLYLGMQLHELTQISLVAGLGAVVVLLVFDQRTRLIRWGKTRKLLSVVYILVALCVSLLIAQQLDVVGRLRGAVPLWSAGKANDITYYISALSVHLPFVWPLFPLMAVFSLFGNIRLALYCLVAMCIALLINSLAAQKATRYFFHAFPLICMVWGIGLQKLVLTSSALLRQQFGWRREWCVLSVLTLICLCLLNTHEVKRGLKLAMGLYIEDQSLAPLREPDWLLAKTDIERLLPTTDTLIATSAVKSLFAFGRYDYELSATVVQETKTGKEFGVDPRTGRQVISTPESISRVIEASGQEVFVLENRMLNQFYSVPVETVKVLNEKCRQLELSNSDSELSAWVC